MRRRDPGLLRLLKFEYDECALCGTTDLLHLHHVVFRSNGGDDVRANIVCLCLEHHDGAHRDREVQALLGEYLIANRPDTIRYLADRLGKEGAYRWFIVHGGKSPLG